MSIIELPIASFAAWADQARALGRQPVVLDVREPWEYAIVHAAPPAIEAGALLLHVPMNELPSRLAELPAADTPLACLCHHGVRSLHVAHYLAQQGFSALANLTGGIDAWSTLDPRLARY